MPKLVDEAKILISVRLPKEIIAFIEGLVDKNTNRTQVIEGIINREIERNE